MGQTDGFKCKGQVFLFIYFIIIIPHRHAVDRPQLLSDGEDVQQGLGRMLPHTVSSVDHRLTAMT